MTGVDLRNILSRNIKFFRNLRSLSQTELAEKADISVAFLSNIERGNKWPYPTTLVNLAGALNISVHELFQEETRELIEQEKDLLTQFMRDLTFSMNKSIPFTISQSLESIGKLYLEGKSR
jgi:transcriptional regulator with XRE-family HTH domain